MRTLDPVGEGVAQLPINAGFEESMEYCSGRDRQSNTGVRRKVQQVYMFKAWCPR